MPTSPRTPRSTERGCCRSVSWRSCWPTMSRDSAYRCVRGGGHRTRRHRATAVLVRHHRRHGAHRVAGRVRRRAQRRAPPRGHDFPGTTPNSPGTWRSVDIADPERSPRRRMGHGRTPGGVPLWATARAGGHRWSSTALPTGLPHARLRLRAGKPPMGAGPTLGSCRPVAPGLGHRRHADRAARRRDRWTDKARQAADLPVGRVLLAGDAGARALAVRRSGAQSRGRRRDDLGWKLGAVAAGWAPEGLLDTYDAGGVVPLAPGCWTGRRAQIGVMRGEPSRPRREVVGRFG